ncbi:MAG: hypothetical protein CMM58_01665 [Rhodospirillaceae bacterium]|nr:hypothetical protein [Rhodospirillaceae bacterium]|tara:strand:+ start:2809 stop:3423 length:615 start_codon:yes stop_codon:yes gene_type:complete
MKNPSTKFTFIRRVLFSLTILFAGVWLVGLVQFVSSISKSPNVTEESAEAIVVLTGGNRRLTAGIDLFLQGRATSFFVSGVNEKVRISDIRRLFKERSNAESSMLVECCVTLGYAAENTQGNAIESSKWVKNRGYKSLFLVTSNYHMKRSLLEFKLQLPRVKIIEYPVIANNLMLDDWWFRPGSLKLLLSEYHKVALVGLRSLI